jgi:hypothetical protein
MKGAALRKGSILAVLLLPLAASAYTPNEGVPFTLHRGLFAETALGALFTVGGRDGYSNAQSFVQLGLGVDITERWEVGALLGVGASDVNCFAQGSAVNGTCTAPGSFTVAMGDGFLGYLAELRPRLFLTPKLFAGYTNLGPHPLNGALASYSAFNAGLGLGVEYATSLEHLSVGIDVMGRYVFNAKVPAIALFPRLKYTF